MTATKENDLDKSILEWLKKYDAKLTIVPSDDNAWLVSLVINKKHFNAKGLVTQTANEVALMLMRSIESDKEVNTTTH